MGHHPRPLPARSGQTNDSLAALTGAQRWLRALTGRAVPEEALNTFTHFGGFGCGTGANPKDHGLAAQNRAEPEMARKAARSISTSDISGEQ